jgi:hypothetical protein
MVTGGCGTVIYGGEMGGLGAARRFALALPGVTEEPHFGMPSFRVRGKIFVTVPDGARLHVFVDPLAVAGYVAEDPAAFEPLRWGEKTRGLRVNLAAASAARVREVIEESWRRKAPKAVVAAFDEGRRD